MDKVNRTMLGVVVLLCALVGIVYAAGAHDPDHHYDEWFERQHNINGGSCCGKGDAQYLDEEEWTSGGGMYHVWVEGHWYDIPNDHMLDTKTGGPNPTGKAIVWYNHDEDGRVVIYCFTPSWEA